MIIQKLYKYIRKSGGVTISTKQRYPLTMPYIELYRLIADDGKVLTNGEILTPCVDVESVEGWEEIAEPTESTQI